MFRFGTLFYLAFGLLIYYVLYAPVPFNWASPWVYIVTLAWPFALMYEFLSILIVVAIILFVIYFCQRLWNL